MTRGPCEKKTERQRCFAFGFQLGPHLIGFDSSFCFSAKAPLLRDAMGCTGFTWTTMALGRFALIFHNFPSCPWFSMIFHDFSWFSSFTWFHWISLDFTRFYWILLGFTRFSRFNWFLLRFTGLKWILPGFRDLTGFYWVLLGFSRFY